VAQMFTSTAFAPGAEMAFFTVAAFAAVRAGAFAGPAETADKQPIAAQRNSVEVGPPGRIFGAESLPGHPLRSQPGL
jgi:hypothetical protein